MNRYNLCKCGNKKLRKRDVCYKCFQKSKAHNVCKCGNKKRKESNECRKCFTGKTLNKVIKNCKFCGKEFIRLRSTLKYNATDYCSEDCYHKSRIGKKQSFSNKKWWAEHPEEKEKASQRGKKYIDDPCWIKKVSSFGEKNPMWRGGIANKGYKNFYKSLKIKILKRDNYKCQLCGIGNEEHKKQTKHNLTIHHIDYNKENSNPKNLIVLCKSCNSKINHSVEKWKKYFQEKIGNIYGNGK